jgi:hypothetical protein
MTLPSISPATQKVATPEGGVVTLSTVVSSYTPPPVRPVTYVGICPRSGASAAAVTATDDLYQAKAAVTRLFFTGALGSAPVSDRFLVTSFNALNAPGVPYPGGHDVVAYRHEADHAFKNDPAGLAAWKVANVNLRVAGVPVCVSLTGWAFVLGSGVNPDDYVFDGATHLMVDLDGLSPDAASPGYTQRWYAVIAAVVAFCAKHGLTWGVGELEADRSAADPSGVLRVAWATTLMASCIAAGALYVCLWENPAKQPLSAWDTDAERSMVHTALTLGPRAR